MAHTLRKVPSVVQANRVRVVCLCDVKSPKLQTQVLAKPIQLVMIGSGGEHSPCNVGMLCSRNADWAHCPSMFVSVIAKLTLHRCRKERGDRKVLQRYLCG